MDSNEYYRSNKHKINSDITFYQRALQGAQEAAMSYYEPYAEEDEEFIELYKDWRDIQAAAEFHYYRQFGTLPIWNVLTQKVITVENGNMIVVHK